MKNNAEPLDRAIKVVGKSGQISLGKSYAGRTFRLERRNAGTLLLTKVPDSQMWTLQEPHRSRIDRALKWAARNQPLDLSDIPESTSKELKRARRPAEDGLHA